MATSIHLPAHFHRLDLFLIANALTLAAQNSASAPIDSTSDGASDTVLRWSSALSNTVLITNTTPGSATFIATFLCVPSQLGYAGFEIVCRGCNSLGGRSRNGGGGDGKSKSKDGKSRLKLHIGNGSSDDSCRMGLIDISSEKKRL